MPSTRRIPLQLATTTRALFSLALVVLVAQALSCEPPPAPVPPGQEPQVPPPRPIQPTHPSTGGGAAGPGGVAPAGAPDTAPSTSPGSPTPDSATPGTQPGSTTGGAGAAGSSGSASATPSTPGPAGSSCDAAADCASGVCEGQGCGSGQGVCAAKTRRCTRDRRPYCGCDGKTFYGSGNCPGQRFSARGPCGS